ncbi:MAG: hypothetical protein A4E45_00062 [Methanosaeta sp. PtaB.Bin039]|nr:MAG: hypothetical protein A4E45_00062 [Methanosaeta sp. PtaB.Bin039]
MADRWFVRCNASGIVTKGFTDDFEVPLPTDIEITNQAVGRAGRHFRMLLNDAEDRPMWKVVDGQLQQRSHAELEDAEYLQKMKRQAIRSTKDACNVAIAEDWDCIEMIGRCMLAIDKLLTKTGETAPAKYANMKTKIEPLTTARDTRIAAIKACTTLAELEALLNG